MIAQGRDSWVYDDFEQFLLDSARSDQAPGDLPERLGVALGLSIPVVLAAELAPSVLSLSSQAPAAIAASKSTGIWASGTLWITAVKGMAIGLLAGASAISAGEVAVAMTDQRPPPVVVKDVRTHSAQPRKAPAPSGARSTPALSAIALHPTSEDPGTTTTSSMGVLEEPRDLPSKRSSTSSVAVRHEHASERIDSPAIPAESRPPSPELSTKSAPVGVASFEVVTDETKPAIPRSQQEAENEAAVLSPEDYRKLRAKTIAHVRTLLGRNQASEAITVLDRFRTRVGASRFGVEELLLRVEALVHLGRSNEALRTADLIGRLAPNSAELRRARLIAGSRHVR